MSTREISGLDRNKTERIKVGTLWGQKCRRKWKWMNVKGRPESIVLGQFIILPPRNVECESKSRKFGQGSGQPCKCTVRVNRQ